MAFHSSAFVVFLLIALGTYWATPFQTVRRVVLLVASLVFYAFWDFRFVALVFYVTAVAWGSARAAHSFPSWRRGIVSTSIVMQLGQLAFFKYTNFLLATLSAVALRTGLGHGFAKHDILLPVGVSFYTFHGISYVVDCHRGKIRKPCDFVTVAIYIVFFPQLVAGPIVRADVFLPQLARRAVLGSRDAIVGVKFLALGLVYKAIFADRLGPLVDKVFAAPLTHDSATLLRASLGFYAQIYFDFAGYSLMAIGTSRLFGFKLPRNFDHPYRSTSITEFWRRWHISLSTWLRDYLYIPLGGNRHGEWKQYRNLMITMLLGGLWHGASFNFVVWGALHGVALAVHKLYTTHFRPEGAGRFGVLTSPLAWLATQAFVLLAWIPFRAKTFGETWIILRGLFLHPGVASAKTVDIPLTLLVLPLVVDQLLVQNPKLPALPVPRNPWVVAAVLGAALAATLPFLPLEVQSFIYFQF